jgi:hypothetical protein
VTSLDELLEEGDRGRRQAAERSRGWRRQLGWAVKATLAAAALGAALSVVLLVLDIEMWYPLAAAGILAVLVLHRIVARLEVAPPHRRAEDPEREPDSADPDGLRPAVHQWQVRLGGDRAAAVRAGRALRPPLAELVDERLRQRHGCTRASDPGQARALLGERLWAYLADPAARTPSPRDLAAMLTVVEAL